MLHNDTHNVLGATLDAKEAECDVLAFSRDLDRDAARKDAVEEGIQQAPAAIANAPEIIGGVAIPALEGWILALLEVRRTEEMTPHRAQELLSQRGVAPKDGAAMVRVVEGADLAKVPKDASSLHLWLDRARDALPPRLTSAQPAE